MMEFVEHCPDNSVTYHYLVSKVQWCRPLPVVNCIQSLDFFYNGHMEIIL